MRPLRMHQTMWLVCRGSKTIPFLESPTQICPFTIQLLRGVVVVTTTIKGRLLSSRPSRFRAKNLSTVKMGAQWRFWGGNVKLWVQDPQKAHPCAELHLLMYFVKSWCRHLGCRQLEEPKKWKIAETKECTKTCIRENETKWNPLSNLHIILRGGK